VAGTAIEKGRLLNFMFVL